MSSNYSVMSQIHVWMGLVASAAELGQYFRIDPVSRAAGTGGSQFDRDTGLTWYDDDLIGVFYSEFSSLEACLNELPSSSVTVAAVRAAYLATGSPVPNALFYYTDASLTVPNPQRLFSGLHYLGVFDNA